MTPSQMIRKLEMINIFAILILGAVCSPSTIVSVVLALAAGIFIIAPVVLQKSGCMLWRAWLRRA